jgi:L-iditol 2-dehydrogenase
MAAGICGSDVPRVFRDGAHIMPLIPGHEFSGVVEAVGDERSDWIGKRVGIFPLIPCGECLPCRNGQHEMCRHYNYLGSRRDGGFAEYVIAPVKNLIELPDSVTFEQAAMLEPMAVAVHAMRRLRLTEEYYDDSTARIDLEGGGMKIPKLSEVVQKFSVKDVSLGVAGVGTIGMLLVMFLWERGFRKVYVACNKDLQVEKLRAMGLKDENICDSRKMDAGKFFIDRTDGTGVDAFYECVGRNETAVLAIDSVRPGGSICFVGNPYSNMSFSKDVYWKILRNQISVTGTWNSSFFTSDAVDPVDGKNLTDWEYVVRRLQDSKIAPENFISHRFPMEGLIHGLEIMRDKKEDYLKVMVKVGL